MTGIPRWQGTPREPIEHAPFGYRSRPERREQLHRALHGVTLGAYDERIIDWLSDCDDPTVTTIASLIIRARETPVPKAESAPDEAAPGALF